MRDPLNKKRNKWRDLNENNLWWKKHRREKRLLSYMQKSNTYDGKAKKWNVRLQNLRAKRTGELNDNY